MAQVLCHLPKFEDPNLLVGFETSDDAAVYKINDTTALIQTVDLFPPVVDDPYAYGQIAAANSLSDIYAMGGEPTLCMNIFAFPENMPPSQIQGILEGGYDKVKEAGAIIAGGHTLKDEEPKYGLCVTGFAKPDQIWTNSGAKEGDLLILTKPLGSGILNLANKADLLSPKTSRNLEEHMKSLNKTAYEIMKKYNISSCTDVTGFGLMGHSFEMAQGSNLTIEIYSQEIPLMDNVEEMAKMGIIPGGAYANREYLEPFTDFLSSLPLYLSDIFFDPQTSGGLLFSIDEKDSHKILQELKSVLPGVNIIGQCTSKKEKQLVIK